MLLAAQRRAGFPLSATLELTRRCNLRCAHCFLDLDHEPGLPSEVIRRVISELAEAGSLFLTLTGGEICVRPDWLELARFARGRGFVLRLKTNGTLMTEDQVRQVADLPVMAVDVSLYGHAAEVHDGVTGMLGSFDRTMATVVALRQRDVRVSLRLPVLGPTAAEVGPIIGLARELGCELVVEPKITPPLDAGCDNTDVAPSVVQVEEAVAILQRELTEPPVPRGDISAADNPWPCLTLQTGIYVRADGEIWRCPIFPISFGSVFDGPIKDVWSRSESRLGLMRLAARAPRECVGCELVWACQRCPAQAWLEHGTLERPARVDCRLAAARSKGVLAESGSRCDTCVVVKSASAVGRSSGGTQGEARREDAGRVS